MKENKVTKFGKYLLKVAGDMDIATRNDLARRIKVSAGQLSSVITGRKKPNPILVENCCMYLQMTKLQRNELIEIAAEENGFVKNR